MTARIQSLTPEQLHKIDSHLLELASIISSDKVIDRREDIKDHMNAIHLFCASALHCKLFILSLNTLNDTQVFTYYFIHCFVVRGYIVKRSRLVVILLKILKVTNGDFEITLLGLQILVKLLFLIVYMYIHSHVKKIGKLDYQPS